MLISSVLTTFYQRYFAGLKGANIVAASFLSGGGMYAFLLQNAPTIPEKLRLSAAILTAITAAFWYFLNPKKRDWLPGTDDLLQVIDGVVQQSLTQHGPVTKESLLTALRAEMLSMAKEQAALLRTAIAQTATNANAVTIVDASGVSALQTPTNSGGVITTPSENVPVPTPPQEPERTLVDVQDLLSQVKTVLAEGHQQAVRNQQATVILEELVHHLQSK